MTAPTVNLAPLPVQRFTDNNGAPLVGGLLFAYAAGTTTKQATYTDSTGSTPNANPIVLNSRGEANVWLDQTLAYKLTLSPSTDSDPPTNAFWTVDNIPAGGALQALLASTAAGSGADLVSGVNRVLPTIAALRALTSATTTTTALVTSYYGDWRGGGGIYTVNTSDTTSSDNGGTIIVDAANRRWYLSYTNMVSVMSFGAKGDGTTDDTNALQAAINWAQVIKAWLYFPAVYNAYMTTGLTIGVLTTNYTCHFQGGGFDPSGAQSAVTTGQYSGQSMIKLLSGTNNASVVTVLRDAAQPQFRNITFQGNRTQVTGTSYCLYLPDTTAQAYYTWAAWCTQCYFEAGRSGGLYIGTNRGGGSYNDCWWVFNGTTTSDSAVNIRCYDQQFVNPQIGVNAGIGMYIGSSTQIQVVNPVYFMNYIGLVIDYEAGAVQITQPHFDSNAKNGCQMVGAPVASGSPGYGYRALIIPQFSNNGTLATNTYSDLLIDGDRRAIIVAPNFNGNKAAFSSTVPKYNIEIQSTLQTPLVQLVAAGYEVDSGAVNGTAFANTYAYFVNSLFGSTYLPQDTGASQSAYRMFAGTGAPSNSNGNNGDFYFRGDTPGTANQRLYNKQAGSWVGIL